MSDKIRIGRKRRREDESLDREETIKAMVGDPWVLLDGIEHPLLQRFSDAERGEILAEAHAERWRRREAERRPVLLARLRDWPVSAWGSVFCEQPELEQELTPEQAEQWRTWLATRLPASSGDGGLVVIEKEKNGTEIEI